MKWSWTIGRIAGIKLRVHATFLILLAWLALVDYRTSGSMSGALIGVLFTLALFGSVLLHELGHAVAARRVGVPTRDITLLPIGGVARLEYIPDKPKQELGIALAGPVVTVIIALLLGVALGVTGHPLVVAADTVTPGALGTFAAELLWLNVALLVFNMLPAFPMDGGRVLRALLALRMDYTRATDIAARTGRGFALVFGVIGLLYNPFLVLIALFVWMSAAAEGAETQQRSALSGVQVNRLMIRDVHTLTRNATLNDALRIVLTGFQHDFPVLDGEQVVGVLTRATLLAGIAKSGVESSVGDAMETSFRTVSPEEQVNDALARLRECRCRTLPVVENGKLCGLLTTDNISEFVLIDAALHKPAREPRHRESRRVGSHPVNQVS
jgi:Zn-dependent protease/CBS domain-containing protein